jgi:acetyl/propionyl-CoA carboxylase alpha subunit
VAKLTVSAESRGPAIDRTLAALRSFPVLGIRTNIPFLIRLLDHPEFRAGRLHTGFIDRHLDDLVRVPEAPPEALAAAAMPAVPGRAGAPPAPADPWTMLRDWGR